MTDRFFIWLIVLATMMFIVSALLFVAVTADLWPLWLNHMARERWNTGEKVVVVGGALVAIVGLIGVSATWVTTGEPAIGFASMMIVGGTITIFGSEWSDAAGRRS